ncbi:MAG TPA: hypothetical protein VEZ13_16735 [Brevibacillus sp.]|nr:hypothetical protein [Brevibacillus sp.]
MKKKMAVAVMAMAVSAMASSAFAAQEDTTYQKLSPAVKTVKAELMPAKLVTIQSSSSANGTQDAKVIKTTPISIADKAVMMEAVKTTLATPKK